MSEAADVKNVQTLIYIAHRAENLPKVWGITSAERLRRVFTSQGGLITDENAIQQAPDAQPVIVISDDHVYDKPILSGLLAHSNTALEGPETARPIAIHTTASNFKAALEWLNGKSDLPKGVKLKTPLEVGNTFNDALRKKEAPYCLALDRDNIKPIEHRIFMGTYKGVTDVVTKYVWPRPAMVVTRWCANLGISPNVVTIVGVLLMLQALYLFWQGAYVPGLIAGWIFTFFDTVDGKLARVQFTASKFGHALDHGTDLIHPPFWYVAWALGLEHVGLGLSESAFYALMIVVVGGYIFQRIQEGYFIARFGMHMHIWRRFDSFFRLITTRRNPNMVLMTVCVILGRPDWAIWAIAAWTIISIAVHMEQIISAEIANMRGKTIASWLNS